MRFWLSIRFLTSQTDWHFNLILSLLNTSVHTNLTSICPFSSIEASQMDGKTIMLALWRYRLCFISDDDIHSLGPNLRNLGSQISRHLQGLSISIGRWSNSWENSKWKERQSKTQCFCLHIGMSSTWSIFRPLYLTSLVNVHATMSGVNHHHEVIISGWFGTMLCHDLPCLGFLPKDFSNLSRPHWFYFQYHLGVLITHHKVKCWLSLIAYAYRS